jgi:hypothetical protein
MARKNILDYKNVLYLLDVSLAHSEDRVVSLDDIIEIFVRKTDKSRPETIMRHVDYMCKMNLIQKKGERSYLVAKNWKELVDNLQ